MDNSVHCVLLNIRDSVDSRHCVLLHIRLSMDSVHQTKHCVLLHIRHSGEKGGDSGDGQLVGTNQAWLAGWAHILQSVLTQNIAHPKMTNTSLENPESKNF